MSATRGVSFLTSRSLPLVKIFPSKEGMRFSTFDCVMAGRRARLVGCRFFTRVPAAEGGRGRLTATPLLLALLLVELSDVLFALDSVPAIFFITTDPFIVYASNIFAVLGLRALYFALSEVMRRFEHLRVAMGLLLGLAGIKIFYNALVAKIDPLISLAVTVTVLAAGAIYSLWRTRERVGSHNDAASPDRIGPTASGT